MELGYHKVLDTIFLFLVHLDMNTDGNREIENSFTALGAFLDTKSVLQTEDLMLRRSKD